MNIKNKWENIHSLKEHHITYLLYLEGKSIEAISVIRKKNKKEVEKDIIKSKLEIKENTKDKDLLIDIISMEKEKRLKFIERMDNKTKDSLCNDVYRRYIKFKNVEDRMILIWLIGELKDEKLLPFLRMELKSKNTNFRRLACSALGKISNIKTKRWLEDMIDDNNPQVRQYSIKALKEIGDFETINKLESVLKNQREKEYVKRAARNVIECISDH
ncbi:MAG: hypothetical protein FH753_05500 [Firmicutes bacterium]|nr:hypothetical protein [Bacillota bacterium]